MSTTDIGNSTEPGHGAISVDGGQDKPPVEQRQGGGGETFKTVVGLLLALVTIIGALVAWRSALAGVQAGNFDDAGIAAALNAQETNTLGNIISNRHRSLHMDYLRNQKLAMQVYDQIETAPQAERDILERQVEESLQLSSADKRLFPTEYLAEDDTYDSEKEQAEYRAEAERTKDLDPDKQFRSAVHWREKSVGLVATLILLGIALWLLALAETVDHRVKYALAGGGVLFMVIGTGAAVALEMDAPGGDVYPLVSMLSMIAGAAVALAAVAMLALTLARRRGTQTAESEGDADDVREERFKATVTMLIASVTLMAAIVAYLQADSGARGDNAIRRSQRLAAESLGIQASGQAQVSYEYAGATRAFKELNALAATAAQENDQATVERYVATQSEITELSKSKLLGPPYFDPANANVEDEPDVAAYEADQYVTQATVLSERSAIDAGLENAWEEKSNTYIIHLTLLAAALALFGLSMTFSGRVRPIFLGLGTLMVAVTLAWIGTIFFQGIKETPLEAIEAYGKGTGLAYVGEANRDEAKIKEAIASFDRAISLAPEYGNALFARGDSKLALGDYAAAAGDFEKAEAAGKRDITVGWNLGWTYYLEGRLDDAVRVYRRTLDRDPNSTFVRFSLGAALLASGKVSDAEQEYTKGMDQLTQQVKEATAAKRTIPPSVWQYMEEAAIELDGLWDRLEDVSRPSTEAPPKDKIANQEQVLEAAQRLFTKMRELEVGLETTGSAPTGQIAAQVSPFQFGTKASDETTELTRSETFPYGVAQVWATYEHSGLTNGQKVIWKVYLDGEELLQYRQKFDWQAGTTEPPQAVFPEDLAFSFTYYHPPGEYTVEMYVDNHLVQRSGFVMEEPEE